MEGTSIAALVLLGTFVSKLMDFGRFVLARDWNAAATQAGVWVLGVVAVFLFSATDFAAGVGFEGVSIEGADAATKVFIGLMLTSLLSKVVDLQKAVDNTQSSAVPSLISPRLRGRV